MHNLTDLEFLTLAVLGFGVLCACCLCVFTLAIEPKEIEKIDEERV